MKKIASCSRWEDRQTAMTAGSRCGFGLRMQLISQTLTPQSNMSNRKWSTSGLPAGNVGGEERHSLLLPLYSGFTTLSHTHAHTHTHTQREAGKYTALSRWYLSAVRGSERPCLKLTAVCELKWMLCLIKVSASPLWLCVTDTRLHDSKLWSWTY